VQPPLGRSVHERTSFSASDYSDLILALLPSVSLTMQVQGRERPDYERSFHTALTPFSAPEQVFLEYAALHLGSSSVASMKVSVVMPVYNERATLRAVVERVLSAPFDLELLCVDDGSQDGSQEILAQLQREHPQVRCFLQPENMGKGAALRRGIREASGEFVIIQDADMEYDPADYPILLEPLIQDKADVVYGSRFMGSAPHRVLYFWHSVGNRLLTLLSNCLTNVNLSDMETCYKAFRREVIQSIPMKENRFGFEPEITVKIAKRRLRIFEVGISYWGRTYEEGKKINWRDGVSAVWCLLKYSIKERAVAIQSANVPLGPAAEPAKERAPNAGR